jgi:hypothetical protein
MEKEPGRGLDLAEALATGFEIALAVVLRDTAGHMGDEGRQDIKADVTQQGIGPWQNYPPLAQYVELDMPNRDAFMALRYKFANLDNVQIQLCEPGPADSP